MRRKSDRPVFGRVTNIVDQFCAIRILTASSRRCPCQSGGGWAKWGPASTAVTGRAARKAKANVNRPTDTTIAAQDRPRLSPQGSSRLCAVTQKHGGTLPREGAPRVARRCGRTVACKEDANRVDIVEQAAHSGASLCGAGGALAERTALPQPSHKPAVLHGSQSRFVVCGSIAGTHCLQPLHPR